MSDVIKISTGMKHEGGRTKCTYSGHADLTVAGMHGIEDRPDAWSPVHLLVAAMESCFFLTLSAVAEKMRIGVESYASTAEGQLTSADGKHKEVSEVVIRPTIKLKNEEDRAKLPQLFKIAEENCYVARSLKAKLRIEA
jgi:organic hydroperoxide reductase OsmC/OhrA